MKKTKSKTGKFYYFDKNGRRISEKSYKTRLKISRSLRKFHAKNNTSVNRRAPNKRKNNDAKKTVQRNSRSGVKSLSSSTKIRSTGNKKFTSLWSTKRTRKKVKAITDKKLQTEMIVNKKLFTLKNPLDMMIADKDDFENLFEMLLPRAMKFFKMELKNKRKKRIMNIGYKIQLLFVSQFNNVDPTEINTTSYLDGREVNPKNLGMTLTIGLEKLKESIIERFFGLGSDDLNQSYTEKIFKGSLVVFNFLGLEMEVES